LPHKNSFPVLEVSYNEMELNSEEELRNWAQNVA
jgi:hypothetical protein